MVSCPRPVRRAAAMGAVATLACGLAVIAPTAANAASAAPPARSCSTGVVAAEYNGLPHGFKAGSPAGYWVWHDGAGWHMRVTHTGHSQITFSGVITTSSPMRATAFKLERGDHFALGAARHSLAFTLHNYGGVDGINIAADCSQRVSFRLYEGSKRISVSHINLGQQQFHPLTDPFTVTRVPITV